MKFYAVPNYSLDRKSPGNSQPQRLWQFQLIWDGQHVSDAVSYPIKEGEAWQLSYVGVNGGRLHTPHPQALVASGMTIELDQRYPQI